jgi:hypothetical protein
MAIRNFTVKDVAIKLNKKEISKLNEKQVGFPPGSKEYLAGYQKSRAEFTNSLPEETINQYQKEADRWNEFGAPEEVKRE